MADTPKSPTAVSSGTPTATASKKGGDWVKVVLTHPSLNGRTVFRSLSESRARKWVENHYPRGSEAHIVLADGTTEAHEAERTGERGADADRWAPFDPEEWVPTEQAPPPGQDEWADKEG
jgi:hypothetical protein